MNGRWSGAAALALVVMAALGSLPAAAQVGVSMGSPVVRPATPGSVSDNGATPGNTPAAPTAASSQSQISRPSQPGQLPEPPASTARDTRVPTSLMGMSPSTPPATTAVDFGAVLNTGSRMNRDNASKICPPGTVNRNNFCSPPVTGVMPR